MSIWIDSAGIVVEDTDEYIDIVGNTFPWQFPKSEIPGLIMVEETPRPDENPSAYTIDGQPRGGIRIETIDGREWRVEMRGGVAVQSWNTAPRPDLTPDEAQAVADRDLKIAAQAALDASDRTALRCFEAGMPLPMEWTAYRSALRTIVAGGTGPLPERPPYPEGT